MKTQLTIASYGVPVLGALIMDKEDATCLAEEAPGGILVKDEHAWRVKKVEITPYDEDSGAVVVTLEPIAIEVAE